MNKPAVYSTLCVYLILNCMWIFLPPPENNKFLWLHGASRCFMANEVIVATETLMHIISWLFILFICVLKEGN